MEKPLKNQTLLLFSAAYALVAQLGLHSLFLSFFKEILDGINSASYSTETKLVHYSLKMLFN